jgi:release factor glutamine methyltransferase
MDDTVIPGSILSDVAGQLRAAGCVFAEDEAGLLIAAARDAAGPSGDKAGLLAEMTARRAGGEPLEHVVGWAEFCGLRIAVDRGVFVPRRRTEFLIAQAASLARQELPAREVEAREIAAESMAGESAARSMTAQAGRPAAGRLVVVDLCCGSGALGAALAAALGEVSLHAADADPAAVACARRNVGPAGGQVYQGDLFAALPARLRGEIDILLANVPYVPADEIALLPAEARDHEPRLALDGGPDGLAVLRRVTALAAQWLAPGGTLLTEVSERQAAAAVLAVAAGGLTARVLSDEHWGATVVTGTRPGGRPRV